ncbi:melanocortin receptor 4-like [Rhopilema esculentum]|uniref:melanocortin receptor 4-like n=1 Tax=Rhopilema esculentum TaxID=499914 RepID=UPI0031E40AE5
MERQHNYAFVAIGVTGVALNALEMIMIMKGGQYRVPFQISVLSLSVADLLACLSVAFCSALVLILNLPYPYPEMLINAYMRTIIFSSISSQLHVIFITIQRLMAVLLPFSCKRILTPVRCSLLLALIWIISSAVTGLTKDSYYIIAFILVTGVVIAFSYAFIVYRIRNRPVVITRDSSAGSDVTLYSGMLFLLFVVCFFPYVILYIIYGTEMGHNGPWIAVYYLYWLNTVTNPIVYFLFKSIKGGAKCLKSNRTTNCIQGAC